MSDAIEVLKEFHDNLKSHIIGFSDKKVGLDIETELAFREALLALEQKEKTIKIINKYFVHGYEQGLSGAVHSKNCRLCKVLKELEEGVSK